jgi:hypothetical protein
MVSRLSALILTLIAFATTGCATIVHSGPRAIPIASTPPGAKVAIYDRSEAMISTHTTPFVASLSPRYGYFKGQQYRLVFEMPGYAPAEVKLGSSVSGWYFGNLLIGGLLGMLVIDPITGAMYNLTPERIEQSLSPAQAQLIRDGDALMVVLVSQTTEAERAAMVRVN